MAARKEAERIVGHPIYNNSSSHSRYVLQEQMAPVFAPALNILGSKPRPMGTRKADLVAQGARTLARMGATEGWVKNITITDGDTLWVAQSWYIYKDGDAWRFKMNRDCKASHAIEGVEA